jgi:hypothetical protein
MYFIVIYLVTSILVKTASPATYNGFIPASTYKLNITASSVLSVSVSFGSGAFGAFRDINIFVYSSSQSVDGGSDVASATHLLWNP